MKNEWQHYKACIEDYLSRCFLQDEPQKQLFEAMRYSLLSGGKRLRPVLTLSFCELCGGRAEDALPFAAAVDMIHTYSLIHDDLPCMDNDDFRRGKPSNHRVYGEAMAVLAGDALLTAAFSQLAAAQLPPERIVRATAVLSHCAGAMGMVGGQALDMDAESRECTREDVLAIQSRKTGALIRSACLLGVIAGNGTAQQEKAAGDYADAIGLAFQIQDDILDVIGDAKKLGKATGADDKKNTFVKIYGVETCREMVQCETQQALDALSAFENAQFHRELALELARRDW